LSFVLPTHRVYHIPKVKKLRAGIRAFVDKETGAVSLFETSYWSSVPRWLSWSASIGSLRNKASTCLLRGIAELRAEIGDAMIYLTELSERLGSNPVETAKGKLEIKYPATVVKGKASIVHREVSSLPYRELAAMYRRGKTY
jgi:hypothetical protein